MSDTDAVVSALEKTNGNKRAAARALGIPESTLRCRLRSLKKVSARNESSISGSTPRTLEEVCTELAIDPADWNITDLAYNTTVKGDRTVSIKAVPKVLPEQRNALEQAVEALKLPPRPKVKARSPKGSKLLEVACTDLHLAKRAWAEECGDDYDCDLARRVYENAIEDTIARVGPFLDGVSDIVLLAGSDYFQFNNSAGTTVSGTSVDSVDTRFSRVFEVGFEMLARSAERLAEIAPVRVVYLEGNHDRDLSYCLAFALRKFFKDNANISVDDTPKMRKYVKYHNTLIGLTHGHGCKISDLPAVMAAEARDQWSSAKFKEIHCGHFHSRKQLDWVSTEESHGVVTRILSALSSSDRWHSENGFIGAKRGCQSFLYDAVEGFIAQFEVGVRE